ncbi:zinc finger HIT domain-containing protein 2 isoform X1 [Punica granatum]|uniref:Zinc finger HIT domain-containing protein 2 isoform X1 n=2 Tax=Punica granatum TaxID=22663 RepID=A0A218WHN6_PUNGR|nr:zinc finger HIT domain-containing protein 2 isoform X1 [Punica granatum]XP_031389671.1 zinc finger HIT domain-containing protein 2 isoform X1 [Punica granatum]OWM72196.1 hypothetical protein CDL15_Pgr018080 [Punica granatum]
MADPVLTSDRSSDPAPLDPASRTICHVCQKQFSQYTCPRCNSRYCSLQCYKSHSVRCTESFMRENVVEELQHVQPHDKTKRKMLDILKRLHSEEEEEEEDSMDEDGVDSLSEETIRKILSGDQISFDDLSAEERKRFQRALASGELSKMIEPWDPWWFKPSARKIRLGQEGNQLVQPINEESSSQSLEDGEESSSSNEIPPGPEAPLPPIRKLSSTEPSPLLPVHLVDIIYSYCFTLRLYNGDWRSDPIGSSMVVLSISLVLGHGGQPETVLEALSHCLEQTCSPAYKHAGGLRFGIALVDDTVSILSLGTDALICLLCDLQRLLQGAEKEMRLEKGRMPRRAEIKSQLKLARRKVYFMMCWAHEQPDEVWSSLAALVRAEKDIAVAHGESKRYAKSAEKPEGTGKVLIEEIQ